MTRSLALTEGQARALIRAARKEGARLEIKFGNAVVTVLPADSPHDNRPIGTDANPETFETLDDYLAWRERAREEDIRL